MAFTKDIEVLSGLTIEGAYLKITAISGGKDIQQIILCTYTSQESADANDDPLKKQEFYFTPSVDNDAPNNFRQAYEYLKTLPEFEGTEDVLEDTE